METTALIYHFGVIAIATLIFFMKFTAPHAIIELIIKVLGKIIPLYCILYAGVQIFKYYGII